jgi:polysaccharide export outer membrane protein
MMDRWRRCFFTWVLLLVAADAATGPLPQSFAQGPAGPGQEYRVGPKDVLRITVYGHEDLTRQVVVAPDGSIQFPLVGDVRVEGLTPGGIEVRLRDLLGRDYLVDPQVSVSVQEYRSQMVFVLGEVQKAGTYPLTGHTTLLDVLSRAGGPDKGAGRQVVIVRFPRAEGPLAPGAAGSLTLRADLKRLLDGDARENLVLQNGDTVYVPKLTSFFVLGEVLRQGAYAMEKETTALEAVTLAGGFTDRAAPSGAKILRKRPDGSQESLDVDLTSAQARDLYLVEGDTLLVPRGNTFFVSGEVRKPGAYQLEKSTTAVGAVTIAGGFTEKAAQSQVKLIRRLPSGQEQTVILDLSGSEPAGRDFPLRDGDTLLVPGGNTLVVSGEVRRPGAYPLEKSMTAFGAVAIAGGFTEKAGQSQVKLIRRWPSGQEQTVVLDLSGSDPASRDFPLRDGDTLLVPSGNAFYVLGEVRKPGAYPLEPNMSAVGAITIAGGFTEKAAQTQAKLTRRLASGEEHTTLLDLSGADPRAREFLLKDGDIPVIPAGNTFYVLGEVKKPGAYQLEQAMTAIQAIAMAGGFTDKAASNRTKVIRTRPDGRQETIVVDLNDVIKRGRKEKDVPLAANDVIVVPESFF